jgi:hypothetical protein
MCSPDMPTGTLASTDITLIWVIPVCYSKYNDNKHSQTRLGISIYIFFAHYVIYSKVVPIYYMFRLGRAIIRYMYKC